MFSLFGQVGSRAPIRERPIRDALPAQPIAAGLQPPALVQLVDAGRSYGATVVFKGISFSVRAGELVLITGPSGAGKTTLLRLIHGQLRPSAGHVWVGSQPLHDRWRRGLARARRQMAMVIQEQRLLPRLSAIDNIVLALTLRNPNLPRRTIRHRAMGSLEAFSLGHRAGALPRQLSAGERQRVAVARAIASRPRILLADEPLAGVDDDNARIIVQLLHEAAANGTAVIVASHEGGLRANRIIRLPSGAVYNRRTAPNVAPVVMPAVPLVTRLPAFVRNAFDLVVLGGLRSWRTDLRLTAPALGTIAALLVLSGALALVGAAVMSIAVQQGGQASLVRVYLATDAKPDAVQALRDRLSADRRVGSVKFVSAEEARRQAASRPGLERLASLTTSNPFPASLDVQVKSLGAVGAVAASVSHDSTVDTGYPTSYDPEAYSRLQRLAWIVAGVGAALIGLFLVVAYVVSGNALRMIAAARRDEIEVMRLLGARQWMLRGPFVVEGLYMGALAGVAAAAVVAALWFALASLGSAVYSQILPGVGPAVIRSVAAGLMLTGPALGAVTALFGFRQAKA